MTYDRNDNNEKYLLRNRYVAAAVECWSVRTYLILTTPPSDSHYHYCPPFTNRNAREV